MSTRTPPTFAPNFSRSRPPPPLPPLVNHPPRTLFFDENSRVCMQRCALFAVVAAVPAFARDRRQTLQEMLNGAYGPAMYCCTQFLVSTPFTLVSAVVYQSIFHWLVRPAT